MKGLDVGRAILGGIAFLIGLVLVLPAVLIIVPVWLVETMMPLSILQTGMGLNVTVVSYCNKIDVGVIVDPELIPDPQTIADAFEHALEELEGAARGVRHVSDRRGSS